ncbi:helix-turn-helix transcriptional regulator [Streptomyces laculatispora]|uniref:helix-turn-helix transcriptional regulator n=1 Tax=Streptomyces laculatispora TaxID=887464 RepID=UPI001A946A96|nr:helix-turn-helix transcriptional regulator [Streptomyces laculatispora]MBO0918734.1 helix-turn-helix transcriptional regulator [Streptomyces laculatispora]
MDDPIRHPLAYARELRGWSQSDLAVHLDRVARRHGLRSGTDKTAVSRWENGRKKPSPDSQILMAEAFGVPVTELELCGWPDWLPGRDLPMPLGTAYTVHVLRDAQKAAMDRRSFMTYSAAALAGLAAQWATIEPDRLTAALSGRTVVDTELIDWLEDTSAKLTALPTEQRQHTIKLADAHLATVTDLIDGGRCTERTGRRLHALAAQLSTTCGWYRFDQGKHYAAGKLWTAALHSSHAAGDRDFGAGVLSDFAYQSNWLGKPDVSVDQLGYAISGTSHPTARSLLFVRRARAYAALGRRAACYRDLSAAEAELSVRATDPAPGWCAWMSPADLAVDSGQCLLDLGRADEARTRMTEGMAMLPKVRDKTRGIFLTYQAKGFLQSNDIEQALAVTTESLDLATRIGAERCVTLVRELAPAFKPYRQVEGVADFIDRLRAG